MKKIFLIILVVVFIGMIFLILQNTMMSYDNLQSTREQKIIEQLKQGPQAVSKENAEYIEQLVLQNTTVAKFIEDKNWESHCCSYSPDNRSYEISITFIDKDNERQLGVTLDLQTQQITNIDTDRVIRFSPITIQEYPYEKIALKEEPGKSFYYHKLNNLDDFPYFAEIYENNTKIITAEQYLQLFDIFSKRCLESNPQRKDYCEDTPLAFEYNSKQYILVNKGLENLSDK